VLERAEGGGLRHALPKGIERIARAPSSPERPSVRQHRSIHRARRRARNRRYLQPWLLEQAVEHAPGEGAMRPTALKGEVYEDRVPLRHAARAQDMPRRIRLAAVRPSG
jgi:hypothetical protein